jgi:hypothetical protein
MLTNKALWTIERHLERLLTLGISPMRAACRNFTWRTLSAKPRASR